MSEIKITPLRKLLSPKVIMVLVTLVDASLASFAAFTAFYIQPLFGLYSFVIAGLTVFIAMTVYILFEYYRKVWRHFDIKDVFSLLGLAVATSLLLFPVYSIVAQNINIVFRQLFVFMLLWFASMTLLRMLSVFKWHGNAFLVFQKSDKERPKMLLVNDLSKAADTLNFSAVENKFSIMGLIGFNKEMVGRSINRISIVQTVNHLDLALDAYFHRYGEYPALGIARAIKTPKLMRRIIKVTASRNVKTYVVGNEDNMAFVRDLDPTDLFKRPIRDIDTTPLIDFVAGKRVFITGGGGSIGQGLALEVARYKPAEIVIFDNSEFNLHSIANKLQKFEDIKFTLYIGDIRNTDRVRHVWKEARPDIVFHAAALKHVPLLEKNVCEGVRTNLIGSINILDESKRTGVKKFVMISTDKAANPTNVLGATKRLAEIASLQSSNGYDMAVSVVRFGNVVGTSGSAIPHFQQQIQNGGPITITDRKMTRYFLTLEEACALVLQAAAMPAGKEKTNLYMLDMGKPISIYSLAENLIRLAGKIPGVEIEIEEIGMRPGEKLHEDLVGHDEYSLPSAVSGITSIRSNAHNSYNFDTLIQKLKNAAKTGDETGCRETLFSVLDAVSQRSSKANEDT